MRNTMKCMNLINHLHSRPCSDLYSDLLELGSSSPSTLQWALRLVLGLCGLFCGLRYFHTLLRASVVFSLVCGVIIIRASVVCGIITLRAFVSLPVLFISSTNNHIIVFQCRIYNTRSISMVSKPFVFEVFVVK